MGKTKSSHTEDEQVPKKRGRQSGAKSYNKTTLLKNISQFKPTNMVVWATVAEQYRIACGDSPTSSHEEIFFQENVQLHEEAYL